MAAAALPAIALSSTLGEAWRAAAARIDRLDARLLLEHVAGCTHATLIASPERPLAAAVAAQFAALVERRALGEPLAYLVGSTGFYGLAFAVSPAVLIPRPETELLVDLALARAAALPPEARVPRLLDLGTGSGAIAVSLAVHLPQAEVSAVERSPAALAVARDNAARNGARVSFREGDWFGPLAGERFDIIVANPPYVAVGDPHLLQNGLPFEPQAALTDGGDGLSCLRAIIAAAPQHLLAGGWLLLEHGYDQAAAVRALLAAAGFSGVASHSDLAGIERVSGGHWPAAALSSA